MKRPRHIASNRVMRLLKSPVSKIITLPWADKAILSLLQHWYFPLSRLWASARAAEGSSEKYFIEAGIKPKVKDIAKINQILDLFEHSRVKNLMTETLWMDYFFVRKNASKQRLLIAEEMRLDTRTEYLLTRKLFYPFRHRIKSSIALNVQEPEVIQQQYPTQIEFEKRFELPIDFPEIKQSRTIEVPSGIDYWICFKSPVLDDMAYARVHEPKGVTNPATLIFGHGIFVEFDHYHNLIDEISALTDMGIRVVRPEAPWHGRRVTPGMYGGEQVIANSPGSLIDFIAAQNQEWAVLCDWCRKTSSGPLAIGGSSLGAQSAKSIAVRAKKWHKSIQPDAMFLVTHSSHIADAALDGSLSDIWNLSGALHEKNWSKNLVRQWLLKLDPKETPLMEADKIISVMGSSDNITPFNSGVEHLDYWKVPQQNRFVYKRGHLTIPIGMIRQQEPLVALRKVFDKLA